MATKLKTLKNFGRPEKPHKELFRQVTCVLRLDTIERLREGAGSPRKFGQFLQFHLDRYPPPTREQYLALLKRTDYWTQVKRKKIPTLMASGSSRQARKLARAAARYQKLSPEQRVWEDAIRQSVTKALTHG